MRESDKIQVIQGSFKNSPSLANRNLCRKQRTVELACTKAYFGCEIFKVLSPLQKTLTSSKASPLRLCIPDF